MVTSVSWDGSAYNTVGKCGQLFETGYEVNVSHVIHDLSFGPAYPGAHNPLDGSERILHDTSGTFKYFLKVGSGGLCWWVSIIPVKSILGF